MGDFEKKCAVVLVPKKIIYMTTAGKKRTHTFSEPTKSLLHGEKISCIDMSQEKQFLVQVRV